MKFEKSKYFEELKPLKVEFAFGTYYFCENFIVGELNEGVHLDWNKAEQLIKAVIAHYGKNSKIAYIANRINAYSIDPQNWQRMEDKYNLLTASAIVTYNNASYLNASLEKQFTNKSIKRCLSLSEAIGWIDSLIEFNQT